MTYYLFELIPLEDTGWDPRRACTYI